MHFITHKPSSTSGVGMRLNSFRTMRANTSTKQARSRLLILPLGVCPRYATGLLSQAEAPWLLESNPIQFLHQRKLFGVKKSQMGDFTYRRVLGGSRCPGSCRSLVYRLSQYGLMSLSASRHFENWRTVNVKGPKMKPSGPHNPPGPPDGSRFHRKHQTTSDSLSMNGNVMKRRAQ